MLVEIPETPAITHPADPDRDGALVQVTTLEELLDREAIGTLATLAVVLPPGYYFTRNSAKTFCDDLPIDVVSEKPAEGIELQSAFLSSHLGPPVLVV